MAGKRRVRGGTGEELEENVEKALEFAKTFLSRTKYPRVPSKVDHEYDDKYMVAEFLAKTGIGIFFFFLLLFFLFFFYFFFFFFHSFIHSSLPQPPP